VATISAQSVLRSLPSGKDNSGEKDYLAICPVLVFTACFLRSLNSYFYFSLDF